MIAALVPAAGSSKRMGRPKLLFKFDGQTVIGRVVGALRAGGVKRVVVIAPPADAAEGPAIAKEASTAGAEIVVPEIRPAEMRESIEHGLERLEPGQSPKSVMVTPADYPGITPEIVAEIAEYAARYPESLVIPTFNGRRGHPIVLPWKVAVAVRFPSAWVSTPLWPSTATSLPSLLPRMPRSFAISTHPTISSTGKGAQKRTHL
jgi:molybdenum cofactor cytidylyltransferase